MIGDDDTRDRAAQSGAPASGDHEEREVPKRKYEVTYNVKVRIQTDLDPDHYPPELDAPIARARFDAQCLVDGAADMIELVQWADSVDITGVSLKEN